MDPSPLLPSFRAAPRCPTCHAEGQLLRQAGTCQVCLNCGTSLGCS